MFFQGAIAAANPRRRWVAAVCVAGVLILLTSGASAASVVAHKTKDRSRFTADDLARVTAVAGAASFVASLVLYQLSQRALIRLDDRLSVRDEEGRIYGIGHAKATEELDWINNTRAAAATTAGLGLLAMGFGVGLLAAMPDEGQTHRGAVHIQPVAGGAWAGWRLRW